MVNHEVLYTAWNVGSFSSQVIPLPSFVHNQRHILFSVWGLLRQNFYVLYVVSSVLIAAGMVSDASQRRSKYKARDAYLVENPAGHVAPAPTHHFGFGFFLHFQHLGLPCSSLAEDFLKILFSFIQHSCVFELAVGRG